MRPMPASLQLVRSSSCCSRAAEAAEVGVRPGNRSSQYVLTYQLTPTVAAGSSGNWRRQQWWAATAAERLNTTTCGRLKERSEVTERGSGVVNGCVMTYDRTSDRRQTMALGLGAVWTKVFCYTAGSRPVLTDPVYVLITAVTVTCKKSMSWSLYRRDLLWRREMFCQISDISSLLFRQLSFNSIANS